MKTTSKKITEEPQADLQALMRWCKGRIEQALERHLPPASVPPAGLHEAMRYAALAGGKYIRPLLVYASGQVVNAEAASLDAPACAVELIHAYSLIHDDLPAMDDDDLRRGKPTCHKVFGEAIAILAGDALQTLAFDILSTESAPPISTGQRLEMISTLASASGSKGMAGGQAIDLAAVGKTMSLDELNEMHRRKTGALIQASVRLGLLCGNDVPPEIFSKLEQYARAIGLAFQIRDDILDVEGSTAMLGKHQGADLARNKPTYPSLMGMGPAKQHAIELHEQAMSCLADLGPDANALRWISEFIVQRPH